MTARPRRPWRVILSGLKVTAEFAHSHETSHTSQTAAYAVATSALRDPDCPATTAKVMQWSDGRWQLFEIVHCSELPSSAWFPTPDPA